MCATNSRRLCLLCLLLYCFTCVKSTRRPYVPRRGSKLLFNDEPTTPHVTVAPEPYYMEKDYFISELMNKYGDGNKISFEGLEHLLYNLGLGGIEKFDHGVGCHKRSIDSEFIDLHTHHNHSKSASGETMNSSCGQYDTIHSHHDHTHEHDDHEIHTDDHDHTGDSHDHSKSDHSHDEHDHSHDDHEHTDTSHAHTDDGHDHMEDHTDHDHTHNDNDGHDNETHTHSEHNEVSTNSAETDVIRTELNTTPDTTGVPSDSVTGGGHDSITHTDHGDHQVRKRSPKHSVVPCLSSQILVRSVKADTRGLSAEEFKELCPTLIYQIDTDTCHSTHSHTSDDHDHFHSDDHDHDHSHETEMSQVDISNVSAKVWGFSTIAVVIISLVGLLGVAVIPIMQKVFYNHLLQFLVALAVGALSGDALLHLLPHAMGGHVHGSPDNHDHASHGDEEAHEHDPDMIYKGLCGLMGIYFFFWTERLLTIFTDSKRKKKEMKNKGKKYNTDDEMIGSKLADQCDGMMMSIHPNKALQNYALEAHKEHCTKQFDDEFVSHRHGPCPNGDVETALNGEERISMINDSPKPHHGHGHSHGIDGVPTSVAAVAWMVILGDGIHNFCDGLAIGAAFVNSITGGFSTSIAVLCHELPHEIGDFAMLLRAGMTAKQAIIYNCLSSILCFIGMLVGVAIGNVAGASLWVFAMVGGMFLYIALVDMLPELSSVDTKQGEHPLCHLLLQCVGMLIGAGVMLIIALYEEDLITILE